MPGATEAGPRGSRTSYVAHGERVAIAHEYGGGSWGVRILLSMESLESRLARSRQMREAPRLAR